MGNRFKALECYHKAIELNENNAQAWFNKAYALDDFEKSGQNVVLAAEKCDKNALSVDDTTFQYSINDIEIELKSVKQTLTGYANQVLTIMKN